MVVVVSVCVCVCVCGGGEREGEGGVDTDVDEKSLAIGHHSRAPNHGDRVPVDTPRPCT